MEEYNYTKLNDELTPLEYQAMKCGIWIALYAEGKKVIHWTASTSQGTGVVVDTMKNNEDRYVELKNLRAFLTAFENMEGGVPIQLNDPFLTYEEALALAKDENVVFLHGHSLFSAFMRPIKDPETIVLFKRDGTTDVKGVDYFDHEPLFFRKTPEFKDVVVQDPLNQGEGKDDKE